MRHATKRAVAVLAGAKPDGRPFNAAACGDKRGTDHRRRRPAFGVFEARAFMAVRRNQWTGTKEEAVRNYRTITCPGCRVAIDAALEGRLP